MNNVPLVQYIVCTKENRRDCGSVLKRKAWKLESPSLVGWQSRRGAALPALGAAWFGRDRPTGECPASSFIPATFISVDGNFQETY